MPSTHELESILLANLHFFLDISKIIVIISALSQHLSQLRNRKLRRSRIDIPKFRLEEILANSLDITDKIISQCHPLEFFHDYLKYGYYPFYLEGQTSYYSRIEQVVTYVIEVEMPEIEIIDISNVRKMKELVNIISDHIPFKLDSGKLASAIEATRETVVKYLHILARAKILNILFSGSKAYAKLAKPDKLYLETPTWYMHSVAAPCR